MVGDEVKSKADEIIEREFPSIYEPRATRPLNDHERINVLTLLVLGELGAITVLAAFVGYLLVR